MYQKCPSCNGSGIERANPNIKRAISIGFFRVNGKVVLGDTTIECELNDLNQYYEMLKDLKIHNKYTNGNYDLVSMLRKVNILVSDDLTAKRFELIKSSKKALDLELERVGINLSKNKDNKLCSVCNGEKIIHTTSGLPPSKHKNKNRRIIKK